MKTNGNSGSTSPKASSSRSKMLREWMDDVRPILTEDAPGLGFSGKELPPVSQLSRMSTLSHRRYGLSMTSTKNPKRKSADD
jgi:hypothetical protein